MGYRLRLPFQFLVTLASAFGSWAVFASRWVMHWPNGPLKTLAMWLGLTVSVSLGALWPKLTRLSQWRRAPVVLLALLMLNEGRNLGLRVGADAQEIDPEAAAGVSVMPTRELVVRHAQATIPGWGAFRVAHLSDLHMSSSLGDDYFAKAMDRATAEAPDIITLGGDFISDGKNIPMVKRLVGRLHARYGVFAVLGNHDYWVAPDAVREALESNGIQVIGGRCVLLQVQRATGSQVLRLCGSEAPWGPDFTWGPEQANTRFDATLVLSHTPDNIYAMRDRNVDALFVGHTHGGQIRLPWFGPLLVPSKYGRRFDQGRFRVDGVDLFVSAGVGANTPAVRILCPPDILVIDYTDNQRSLVSSVE